MSVVWELIPDISTKPSRHTDCIYILSGYGAVGILKFLEDLYSPMFYSSVRYV